MPFSPLDMQNLSVVLGMLALALVSTLAQLVLLFVRRGARFGWTLPAALALGLLPLSASVLAAILGTLDALKGMAITGSGGVAALAVGLYEARVVALPGYAGLAAVLALTLLGFLIGMLAPRSAPAAAAPVMRQGMLAAMTLAATLLMAGVAISDVAFATEPLRAVAPGYAGPGVGVAEISDRLTRGLIRVMLLSGFGLVTAIGLTVASLLLVPKAPAPRPYLAVGAVLLLLLLVGTLGAGFLTWRQMEWLKAVALTGTLPEPSTSESR